MMPYGRSRLLGVKRRVVPTRRLMAEHPRQRSQSVCGIPSRAGLRGSAGLPPARAGVGRPHTLRVPGPRLSRAGAKPAPRSCAGVGGLSGRAALSPGQRAGPREAAKHGPFQGVESAARQVISMAMHSTPSGEDVWHRVVGQKAPRFTPQPRGGRGLD
jgi:hypothetical protein